MSTTTPPDKLSTKFEVQFQKRLTHLQQTEVAVEILLIEVPLSEWQDWEGEQAPLLSRES